MEKYCGRCGKKLKRNGKCPVCNIQKNNEKKQIKWKRLTLGKKIYKTIIKLFLVVVLVLLLSASVLMGFLYLGIADLSFSSDSKIRNLLKTLNEKTIVVEQVDIFMESDAEGTADIIIKMPDYEKLFNDAFTSKEPRLFLLKEIALKNYDIQEYEKNVKVTKENGVCTVHSDETVHQLLEENLINAINSLSEVNDEKSY